MSPRRSFLLPALCCAALLLPASPSSADEAKAIGDAQLYDHLLSNTVEVYRGGQLAGTGLVEKSSGLVVSAAHVVKDGERLVVRGPGQDEFPAEVVARDLGHDLCLLTVDGELEAEGLDLAERMPGFGAEVVLFGAPMFRHAIALRGSVARPTPVFEWNGDIGRPSEIYYFDAPSPVGFSGGPWVDTTGRAVGVQSAMMTSKDVSVGIAFVAGLGPIRALVASREDAPDPFLGAVVEELGEQPYSFNKELPEDLAGVLVKILREGHPASDLLKEGDIVTSVNGQTVTLRDAYYRAVRAADGPVVLQVWRAGEQMEVRVPAGGGE